jgi:hypothetical protein
MRDGEALFIVLPWAGRIGVRPTLGTMPTLERTKLYKDIWARPCTQIESELRISRRPASDLEIRVSRV